MFELISTIASKVSILLLGVMPMTSMLLMQQLINTYCLYTNRTWRSASSGEVRAMPPLWMILLGTVSALIVGTMLPVYVLTLILK